MINCLIFLLLMSCLPMNLAVQTEQQQQDSAPANTSSNYVPMTNITRIMRRVLPPHAKIADDAKETVQQCVSEFINLITSEANERCLRECRKIINALLMIINALGFENYVEPLELFLDQYRDAEREHNSVVLRGAGGGAVMRQTVDFGQFPPPPPPPPLPPPVYGLPPGFPMVVQQPEAESMLNWAGEAVMNNGTNNFGYYGGNGGGAGSSSSGQGFGPSFGPDAQFK